MCHKEIIKYQKVANLADVKCQCQVTSTGKILYITTRYQRRTQDWDRMSAFQWHGEEVLEKGTLVAADLFCSNTSYNKREGTGKLPSVRDLSITCYDNIWS